MIEGGIVGQKREKYVDSRPNIQWSYETASRDIFGSIPYYIFRNGVQLENGLLTADGTFDAATNSMSGTLIDKDKGFQGTFRAQMYGPRHAELGIIFTFSRTSDNSTYFGTYIGQRNS